MPTYLRKRHAGADSRGNVWPHDGAVIAVDDEHAAELLAIPDAGITLADPPGASTGSTGPGEDEIGLPDLDELDITEPAPAPAQAVTEPAPRPAAPVKRTRKPRAPKPDGAE